jgi:hypothetical protein
VVPSEEMKKNKNYQLNLDFYDQLEEENSDSANEDSSLTKDECPQYQLSTENQMSNDTATPQLKMLAYYLLIAIIGQSPVRIFKDSIMLTNQNPSRNHLQLTY